MAVEMKSFRRFAGGSNTDVLVASHHINHRSLAANTAETETVPSGAEIVVIKASEDFWVSWNGSTATVPSSDVTDGTGSELNPTERYIRGVTSFSVISASACLISFSYYSE